MRIILALIYFLLANTSLVIFLKKEFGKTIPLLFILNSIIMYISGIIFRSFIPGIIINIFIPLYSLIYIVKNFKNKKVIKEIKENYLSKGFYIFIIIFAFAFLYDLRRTFYSWDEFSHWGVMIKEMIRLDNFYSISNSNLLPHKDYPPIVQLYELFFSKITLTYKESYIQTSIHLFEMSLFIPCLSEVLNKKNKNISNWIVLFFIGMLLILFFDCHNVINAIYIDYLLSIIIGYILFNYTIEKNKYSARYCFQLCLELSFLILIKQVALPLYAMCLFYIIITTIRDLFVKKVIKNNKQTIVFILLIILIPCMFYFSWSKFISSFEMSKQFDISAMDFSNVIEVIFNKGGEDWQKITVENYYNGIFDITNTTSYIQLNYIQGTVLGLAILLMIGKFSKNKMITENVKYLTITLFIGAIGYMLLMLYLYTFVFGAGEGPILASFNRYMPSYLLIIYSLDLMLIIFEFNYRKKYYLINILFVILVVIQTPSIMWRLGLKKPAINEEYKMIADDISKVAKTEDKVFLVSQNTSGDYQFFVKYYTDGVDINRYFYDLAVEGDTKTIFYNEVFNYIKDYDYVYLAKIDENFAKNYSFLFDSKIMERKMYTIITNENEIKLKEVNEYETEE